MQTHSHQLQRNLSLWLLFSVIVISMGLFLEISKIRLAINNATYRAFKFLLFAKPLISSDKARSGAFGITILGAGQQVGLKLRGFDAKH